MQFNSKLTAVMVFAGVATLSSSAMAAVTTVVVTEPSEVLINTNQDPIDSVPGRHQSTYLNDPFSADTWLRNNLSNHGAVGLTNNYPQSGNGSAWMWGPSFQNDPVNYETSSKADMEYFFGDTTGKTLGNLSAFSYDFYRSSASTAAQHFHPSLRLFYDADGSTGTTNDRGYLIYERANQAVFGTSAVPTNTWLTDDVFGSDFKLWRTQFFKRNDFTARTISTYETGVVVNGMAPLSANSLILGVSTGIGRGWGPWYGAVDNVTIGFGSDATRWNFEVPSDTVSGNTATVGSGAGAVTANFSSVTGGDLTVVQGTATNIDLGDANNPFGAGAAANFAIPAGASEYQVWNVHLDDGSFAGNLELVFTYDDSGMTTADELGLAIYHFNGSAWEMLSSSVDTGANTITVLTTSLSPFALGVAIPEPASLALLAMGGMMMFRRRRR
ncbi:MAG: PEP-CTERM sorting domain-containing protein [Planctomycetes bacterium]|nr:PEP-CTERM sorting domain-containing protein [Planctomycetota bacterium]